MRFSLVLLPETLKVFGNGIIGAHLVRAPEDLPEDSVANTDPGIGAVKADIVEARRIRVLLLLTLDLAPARIEAIDPDIVILIQEADDLLDLRGAFPGRPDCFKGCEFAGFHV